MRVIECDQGGAHWLEIRRGKITASRISDVMDFLKKGVEGASRRNYRIELIAERLSGRSEDHYTSPEMIWGIENEPDARTAYEIGFGVLVDQVGFVIHPTMDFAGGSPDGLVGDDGLIEIKCGKTTTHLKWMLAGEVPEEHQAQILWNLCCTGRQWADFISFDPRMPDGLRLFVVRMHRDEELIKQVEAEVMQFNDDVEAAMAPLRSRIVPAKPKRSAYEEVMEMMDEVIP